MRRLAGLILFVLVLGACSRSQSEEPVPAPTFELKDLSGNTVRLQDFKGHPVFMDFWATWCGPCRYSIPAVEALYSKYKKDGLVVLGMNIDDDRSEVFPFVKHFGMSYPILLAGESTVANDYQVEGIPGFYLIDAQGRVVDRFEGFHPAMPKAWEEEVQQLLKQAH